MRPWSRFALSALAVAALSPLLEARAEPTPNYESIESISVKAPDGIFIAPVIEIASDGSVYTQATAAVAHLSLIGEAKSSAYKWRIGDVQYGIGAMITNGGKLGPANSNFGSFHSVHQSTGDTKHFKQELAFQVPLAESGLGKFAAQRCNAMRKGLENEGMSRLTIFNQDRDITIPVAFHFAARAAWKDEIVEYNPDSWYGGIEYWRQAWMWREINVRCLKAPDLPLQTQPDPTPLPTGPQDFKLKVGVRQAALIMLPGSYTGVCPAELNASATIVTNGPVEVKYRLEKSDGTLSPVRSVMVDHTRTAFFNLKVNVGHDVSQPQPGTVLVGQSAQQAGPAFAAQSAGPNVHQGFFRLRVISPNTVESSPANYQVTCKPKLTGSSSLQLNQPHPPGQPDPAAVAQPGALKAASERCAAGSPCRKR
jgi:hypothetical protein